MDRISGKDNNLNLVRFVAASAVLVSHAFVLSTGSSSHEPLRASMDMSLGDLAVDVFFAVSGFLVSRSLVQRGSGFGFIRSRALRIYPALIVMLLGLVFVVAPLYGSLPTRAFLLDPETRHFLFRNLTLFRGVAWSLPGVFTTAPWKGGINGSLWTMTYEIRLYFSLVAIWWLLAPFPRQRTALFKGLCLGIATVALGWQAYVLIATVPDASGLLAPGARLTLMFYSGVAWWVFSRRVILDLRILLGMSIFVGSAWLLGPNPLFQILLMLCLPYAVWWIAFVPSGWVRNFNRIGDCSYGIYIYAFPIQQMWAISFRGTGPWAMIAGAGSATLALSLLSWHLIEKPALSMKRMPFQTAVERSEGGRLRSRVS